MAEIHSFYPKIAKLPTAVLAGLAGILITIVMWAFIAGAKYDRFDSRLERVEIRSDRYGEKIDVIQSDVAEIKGMLKEMRKR